MRFSRSAITATAVAALIGLGAAPATAAPAAATAAPQVSTSNNVVGSWDDGNGHGGKISGTVTPKSVTLAGPTNQPALQADANLTVEGTATPLVVAQQVVIPVPAGCQVLHLVLGPLDLNLLGLHIVLQQVTLDIVAVPGPGNLLGNLLCALVNILNPRP